MPVCFGDLGVQAGGTDPAGALVVLVALRAELKGVDGVLDRPSHGGGRG